MKNTLTILALLTPLLIQPAGHAQKSCRTSFERMKRVGVEFDEAQKKANDLIAAKATTGEVCPIAIKALRIFDAYNATYKANMDCVCKDPSVYKCKQSYYDEYKNNLESAATNRKDLAQNCKGYFGKDVERTSWD